MAGTHSSFVCKLFSFLKYSNKRQELGSTLFYNFWFVPIRVYRLYIYLVIRCQILEDGSLIIHCFQKFWYSIFSITAPQNTGTLLTKLLSGKWIEFCLSTNIFISLLNILIISGIITGMIYQLPPKSKTITSRSILFFYFVSICKRYSSKCSIECESVRIIFIVGAGK